MVYADPITTLSEENLYSDEIIFATSSPYQRIVLTRWKDDLRLFLNGHLQFSSRDEYRYHEALVHPGLQFLQAPKHVLVLGGGDGLAIREILKYECVEQILLVDLDPEMTRLFTQNPLLRKLNQDSFHSPKVKVINADAFIWLDGSDEMFDFAVIDFPDPTSHSLGKLYTTAFYRLLEKHLSVNGAVVVQATSPLFARRSFWCITKTLESVGFQVKPYHTYVPSFGEWGFRIGYQAALCCSPNFSPGPKVSDGGNGSGTFPISQRYAAGRSGNQPAQQPGSGPILRIRVASGDAVNRRKFLQLVSALASAGGVLSSCRKTPHFTPSQVNLRAPFTRSDICFERGRSLHHRMK